MMLNYPPPPLRALGLPLLSLLILFTQTSTAQPAATGQDTAAARQLTPSILIRWQGKPGVERYRLQLATDAGFNDIVFDRAVLGRQHLVEGLTPGRYFWRTAPAAKETGAFSQPAVVEVKASSGGGVAVANVVAPADLGGWRTATGEVLRPVSAQLRSGAIVDLVGMNSDGTIYAIDGANGIALWTSRFRPGPPAEKTGGAVSRFGPLPFRLKDATGVVVALEGGVRALRGDTGREAWRAILEGRAVSGAAGDMNADGAAEIVVVTSDPHRLYVLDGATGRVLANQKLDAEIVGAPSLLTSSQPPVVALALKDGAVEIRGADGALIRNAKMPSEVTTAPLVVKRGDDNSLMVVGTREGLIALTIDELKPLGRIVPDADVVRGTLTAADVDNDGATEIILLTRRGRVALVSTIDGNVKWYAEGATDAEAAVFADVNADGVLDVIVPGGNSFAVGYSGRDGSLVWKVEEPGAKAQTSDAPARTLVVAPSLGGGAIVVGSDPSRVGLRAVELPKGAVKSAAN